MRKLHSCGAILYTIHNNKVYIILGREYGGLYPFKGVQEKNETYEDTAAREIYEETCQLVAPKPHELNLLCVFSTMRKKYHIGLLYVPYSFTKLFGVVRTRHKEKKYLEKTGIVMFELRNIMFQKLHNISIIPILFYYEELCSVQKNITLALTQSNNGAATNPPQIPIRV